MCNPKFVVSEDSVDDCFSGKVSGVQFTNVVPFGKQILPTKYKHHLQFIIYD
jgi:hypothetical protein